MKEYLKLHYRLLNREINEFGFSPIFFYLFAIVGFYGISVFLFSKTELAEYIYVLICISFLSKLSVKERNEFLKIIFSSSIYRKLRIIENLIISLPFLAFLLWKNSLMVAIILFFISMIISSINLNFNFTISTPFSKRPFEFPLGFRKTFYIFPFAYFLTWQSIFVGNFNLGIASLLLISVVIFSYYSSPENEFYIWIFNLSVRDFLVDKIKTGLIYFTFLSFPILISLIGFFPNEKIKLVIFILLGYFYLTTIILAKYSVYPNEMNLPEVILLGISLIFPPILFGVLPFFYIKSTKQLKLILEND